MKYTLMTLEPNYFIVSARIPRSNAIIVIVITIAMIIINQRNLDKFFWSIFQTNKQAKKKKKVLAKLNSGQLALHNRENCFQRQNLNAFYEKSCFFRLTLKLPEIFLNMSAPNFLNTFRKAITNNTVVICNFTTLLKKKNHPSLFICRYLYAHKSLIGKC